MSEQKPLLSILIPTVVGREEQFKKLVWETIRSQTEFNICIQGRYGQFEGGTEMKLREVEILYLKDNKEITIGEKREQLYQIANGKYSWMLDDDDSISPNAIELILEAIKNNSDVDVISFEEYVNIDGKEFRSNHSNSYDDWNGDGNSILSDGFHFQRTIFFKDVIRTELAKSVPVPRLRWAEDHEWAKLLKPLIKSELHISEQLYRYIHISSNHNERYGIVC